MSYGPNYGPHYPRASLYVGDLHADVTEEMLLEKFSKAAPVLSVKVCRDLSTHRSLGYAHVNFQQPDDAERALNLMNFATIKGRPMRVMWSLRNPSLRKSGVGNVFIKNLDKSFDNKAMYDTFSEFGNILSCKVATDAENGSKGYGFVHFETEEEANKAIRNVNNILLNDRKVYVSKFIPRQEREKKLGENAVRPKNVYIKNFGDDLDDEKLREMFEKYGNITSAKVIADDKGESKGFGFVSFEDPDSAEKACKDLNGKEINGETLYVGIAQKKSERAAELERRFKMLKTERERRYEGVKLYVDNLHDQIDADKLRKEFQKKKAESSKEKSSKKKSSKKKSSKRESSKGESSKGESSKEKSSKGESSKEKSSKGESSKEKSSKEKSSKEKSTEYETMTSVKVMTDSNNCSRGFGFVCFSSLKEANEAVTLMNGLSICSKTIYVAPAPSKEDLKAHLASKYMQHVAGMPMQLEQVFNPGSASDFDFAMPQTQQGFFPKMSSPKSARRPKKPRMRPGGQPTAAFHDMQIVPYVPGAIHPAIAAAMSAGMTAGLITEEQPTAAAASGSRDPEMDPTSVGAARPAGIATANVPQGRPAVYEYPPQPQAVQQSIAQQAVAQPAVHIQGQEPLTASMLADANPQAQKQMIGDRLFSVIHGWYPDMADKITGMLLEMDNSELLHMLEHHESLKTKVDEAVAVLQAHEEKENLAASMKKEG